QMAAAFWDYFAEHVDYAKLILLHASGEDRDVSARIDERASDIVQASLAYIKAAQARGELGDFDPRQFMLWASTHTVTIHGAPLFAAYLYPNDEMKTLRAAYLAMVRSHIASADMRSSSNDAVTKPKRIRAKTAR